MLKFNNKEIDSVYYNGKKLEKVFFNNKLVYESTQYIDKPTVSGAYTFNNTNQSAAVSGFNADQMEQSGTVTAKSAGTYTVKFSLKKGFAWLDGSTDDVSYTWTIGKRSITIPTLSIASFDWVEGTTHSTGVKNLDSTYVNQSGATSQTDTSSNIGAKNTATWTLKYPNDTAWSDGTTTNKSASWSVNWKNGTSHYKNDLYNKGWRIGNIFKLADGYGEAGTLDLGDANKPYMTWSLYRRYAEYLYLTDTAYLNDVHWVFEYADGTSHSTKACLVTLESEHKFKGTHSYPTSVDTSAKSGDVYGTGSSATSSSGYQKHAAFHVNGDPVYIHRIYHT